jgi:hypothetical protein
MYNAPPPHLMQGIELFRSGRKSEALNYLRLAARSEPLTSEGWLWLAAASDDLEEYRFCVEQALHLDPDHSVARRMWDDLQRQDRLVAGVWPGEGEATFVQQHRPSRLRRMLRALVLLVLIGGCVGGIAALAASGVVQDAAHDWLYNGDAHILDFTVGEQPGFRFEVEVPDSWMPANDDSASWRETRDDLIATFPVPADHVSVWEQVGESFSQAVRDPVYGKLLPPVRLVETDPDLLREYGVVTALTLSEILPLPEGATICDQMRLVEQQYADAQQDGELVEASLAVRDELGDCAFVAQRRFSNQAPYQIMFPVTLDMAPDAERAITLAVPVGAERYAVWQLTLADAAYPDYQDAIDRIISTLAYTEPD